jgi:hypothetical protein
VADLVVPPTPFSCVGRLHALLCAPALLDLFRGSILAHVRLCVGEPLQLGEIDSNIWYKIYGDIFV